MTSPLLRPALCVLDTQVLLDWALFDDPRVRPWAEAIQRGSVRWIYCAAMQVEALRVVHYPALAKRVEPQASAHKVADCFARWGQGGAVPPGPPPCARRPVARRTPSTSPISCPFVKPPRW